MSALSVRSLSGPAAWCNTAVSFSGTSFAADHAFTDRIDGDPGYGELLRVAHECSSVTAACLVTRRQDYLDVGGMDEVRFPVNFNDVDYCLKLRARGQRIVFTPHAKLIHHESASRGCDFAPDRRMRLERELQNSIEVGQRPWRRIPITVRYSIVTRYHIRRWLGLRVPRSRGSIAPGRGCGPTRLLIEFGSYPAIALLSSVWLLEIGLI